MSWRRRLLFAPLVAALAACGGGEEPPAERGVLLLPTQSLVDQLGNWRVSFWPEIDLPVDVAVSDRPVAEGQRFEIRGADWSEAQLLPALFRDSLALGTGSKVWRAAPRLGSLPPDADPVLEHEGRRLAPSRLPGGARLWSDPGGEFLFWWDNTYASLVAFAPYPPGELVVEGYGEHAQLLGLESESDAPPSKAAAKPLAEELRHKLSLGREERDGLLVPVPSELAIDVRALDATHLQLVTGVAARTYARDDAGQVLQSVEEQLEIVFAVEHENNDGSRERIWETRRSAEQGFVESVVDVSAWRGQNLKLRLLTEAPDGASGRWPFAFWSGFDLQGGGEPASEGAAPPTSIVILQVEALRPDRMSLYGAPRATTPHLDSWALGSATVYEDALSPGSWTLPGTASLLTGLAPSQHRALRFPQGLADSAPALAQRLREIGYESMALVEGGYVSSTFGFDRGFDVFVEQPFQAADWDPALDWLAERSGRRPVFLYLQTYLVHAPWTADDRFADPSAPYAGAFAGRDITHDWIIRPFEAGRLELTDDDRAYVRDLYDAALVRFDERFDELRRRLDELLDPRARLLVVTSTHGLGLFDDERIEYGGSLRSELLEVPLIVQYPREERAGRVKLPASLLDVVPTVLEEVGVLDTDDLPGNSLKSAEERRRVRVSQDGPQSFAVDFDGWKLHADLAPGAAPARLYDLRQDPSESFDVAPSNPEWARRLRDMLDDHLTRYGPLGPGPDERDVDPSLLAELRALGYLGGR